MDFYNFEKYNDVFCFEKLSYDYQPLLKLYRDSYQTSLNTFLNEYEENTELRFIESQSYFCNKEITIQKSIIAGLEELDDEIFNYVKNRINPKHLKLSIFETSKIFIKFISNRITSLCLINDFLESRKQELEEVPAPENKNPFPLIFTGNDDKAYNVFMDFKKNVTDYYSDYSFIFQKMKGETEMLIEKRCRHKEFMDWLFENKHISKTVHNNFTDKEFFSKKYDRGMRSTQYNIIKEKYFPINSDLSE